jgi:hypothetical protein
VLYLKRSRAKSRELETLWRALQIQRLEGSRPGGLWEFYLAERVSIVCELAVAVRAPGFRERVAERMVMGDAWESLNRTTILRSEECETRIGVRAEAREKFEAGDVDSCGAPAERRRRSEEELRGGEAFDNLHGSAAKRTLP